MNIPAYPSVVNVFTPNIAFNRPAQNNFRNNNRHNNRMADDSFKPIPTQLTNAAVTTLLRQTALQPDGMVTFPEEALRSLLTQGETLNQTIAHWWPAQRTLADNGHVLPAITLIYTAERLAEEGHSIDDLYHLFSQLDRHPHPLVSIYLSGAYAEMHRPEPFGWALMKLMETANKPPNPNDPHTWKLHEELGKLISKQLQLKPELWQKLQPYIRLSPVYPSQ
jgi:hypothetical protein